MASIAKIHSEKYHRLPIPPQQKLKAEHDYHSIFNKLMEFLVGAGGKVTNIPPIFVESGSKNVDLEAVRMTLNKIVAEESYSHNIEFRVFPLEHLLYRLHKKSVEVRCAKFQTTDKPFSSVHMAKEMLNRDDFLYSDLGCEFHSEIDNSANCCLSKVKRWGFRLSQLCLDADRDKLVPGQHIPMKLIMSNQSEAFSTSSKDEDWESEFIGSFCTMEINSVTSVPKSASTNEGSTKTDSETNDTASIYSTEMTYNVAPSLTSESSLFQKVMQKNMKYRDLLNRGRGGKASTSNSGTKS